MPRSWRKAVILVLALAVMGIAIYPVQAQDAPVSLVRLFPFDKSAFPKISTYLDVHDAAGAFVSGLTPGDIRLVENEQELPVDELVEVQPGVQFVLALSIGPAMGIRDGFGLSRYDYLKASLNEWQTSGESEAPDDLSLVVDGGPEAVHQDSVADILAALQGFTPNPRQSTASLLALSRALDIASDSTDRPGMERAVLFITAPQSPDSIIGLQSLAGQAAQADIRVFIWLVASEQDTATPQAQELQTLAQQTGGQYLVFNGPETLPNVEEYLQPLRSIYRLSYRSQVNRSGSYSVTATITYLETQAVSNPQTLEVEILPPNPVFTALPSTVQRQFADSTDENSSLLKKDTPAEPEPTQLTLTYLVEFPDGYARQIAQSALYVDDALVLADENPAAENFAWDLSSYDNSGQHFVKVVVTDTLGLSGSSPNLPVEIVVETPESLLSSRFSQREVWLAGLGVLLAGAVLGLSLLLGGRMRSETKTRPTPKKASSRPQKTRDPKLDPVTQPVSPSGEKPSHLPAWMNRITRSPRRAPAKAEAYLIPIDSEMSYHSEAPIPISSDETVLGRDSSQVTWALSDPALAPVHARIRYKDGQYWLLDEGTIAGSWINFTEVPPLGAPIRHGDLVHLGTTTFRFSLRNPKNRRKPVLIPQEHTQ